MPNFTNLPERHFVDKAKRLSLGDKDSDVYFDGEALEALINTVEDLQKPITTDRIADGAVTGAKLNIPNYKCTFNIDGQAFNSDPIAVFDTSAEAHAYKNKLLEENNFVQLYDPDTLLIGTIIFTLSKGGVEFDYTGVMYYRYTSKLFALRGTYQVSKTLGEERYRVEFSGTIMTIYED